MRKKLLIVIPSSRGIYRRTAIRSGAPFSPPLGVAAVAAGARDSGFEVQIFDANHYRSPGRFLDRKLKDFPPDGVGISFTTPHFPEVLRVVNLLKKRIPGVPIIGGGPHPTVLPAATLKEIPFDFLVVGEGDRTLSEIYAAGDFSRVLGIAYRGGNGPRLTPPRPPVLNLDDLPFPAWEIFELSRYRTSHLLARENPCGWLETSRGCPGTCSYCTKKAWGTKFRAKSPPRVLDEVRKMLDRGFREIHLADDNFAHDRERALEICAQIIRSGWRFPWAPVTGLRVDTLDRELLRQMQRAGCYRVYLGIESGSPRILEKIGKGIRIEKVEEVVSDCRELGLEVFGFFMIGLPEEEEEDLISTLNFARRLRLDFAKVSYTIPLPGTSLYQRLEAEGLLRGGGWGDYNFYRVPRSVYRHPHLDWEVVEKYFHRFYRKVYLNPGFFWRRLLFGLKHRTLLSDLKAFFGTSW